MNEKITKIPNVIHELNLKPSEHHTIHQDNLVLRREENFQINK
jgi:hypothetical protein